MHEHLRVTAFDNWGDIGFRVFFIEIAVLKYDVLLCTDVPLILIILTKFFRVIYFCIKFNNSLIKNLSRFVHCFYWYFSKTSYYAIVLIFNLLFFNYFSCPNVLLQFAHCFCRYFSKTNYYGIVLLFHLIFMTSR